MSVQQNQAMAGIAYHITLRISIHCEARTRAAHSAMRHRGLPWLTRKWGRLLTLGNPTVMVPQRSDPPSCFVAFNCVSSLLYFFFFAFDCILSLTPPPASVDILHERDAFNTMKDFLCRLEERFSTMISPNICWAGRCNSPKPSNNH